MPLSIVGFGRPIGLTVPASIELRLCGQGDDHVGEHPRTSSSKWIGGTPLLAVIREVPYGRLAPLHGSGPLAAGSFVSALTRRREFSRAAVRGCGLELLREA